MPRTRSKPNDLKKLGDTMAVPRYEGSSPLGCGMQVRRARVCTQELALIKEQDDELSIIDRETFKIRARAENYILCECRIAENGCIDPSWCNVKHTLHAVPRMERWCDLTTAEIDGGAHLLFWSGWARPSVLKLYGRWINKRTLRHALEHSHARTKHIGFYFSYTVQFDRELECTLVQLACPPGNGKRGKQIIEEIEDDWRFGTHAKPIDGTTTVGIN
uniref:Uncharacterized protein n=1 Tax=Grapevine-associated negative single-stranded RNA virus 1 TaxID=2814398 RepID=A0A8F5MLY0_9VIRU|nr:MAG: hypothetical protein [Grapevine-associated negative single-stranded RNA virus 1]